MSKLYPLGTKNKTKFCEVENVLFYFLGTKIKFRYILSLYNKIGTKNLFNPI
jgi:hypothetical protein